MWRRCALDDENSGPEGMLLPFSGERADFSSEIIVGIVGQASRLPAPEITPDARCRGSADAPAVAASARFRAISRFNSPASAAGRLREFVRMKNAGKSLANSARSD